MPKQADPLERIARCLDGIYLADLSRAEKQICDILIEAGKGVWGKDSGERIFLSQHQPSE